MSLCSRRAIAASRAAPPPAAPEARKARTTCRSPLSAAMWSAVRPTGRFREGLGRGTAAPPPRKLKTRPSARVASASAPALASSATDAAWPAAAAARSGVLPALSTEPSAAPAAMSQRRLLSLACAQCTPRMERSATCGLSRRGLLSPPPLEAAPRPARRRRERAASSRSCRGGRDARLGGRGDDPRLPEIRELNPRVQLSPTRCAISSRLRVPRLESGGSPSPERAPAAPPCLPLTIYSSEFIDERQCPRSAVTPIVNHSFLRMHSLTLVPSQRRHA